MDAIFSTDLAAASGESLDKVLAAILVAFEGIVQVSGSTFFLSWMHIPWTECLIALLQALTAIAMPAHVKSVQFSLQCLHCGTNVCQVER